VSAVVAEARYAQLLEHGIRVTLYQPTMMHVKAVLIDGAIACVGSVNLNRRSVEKDEEAAVLVLDRDVVAEVERHFDEDVAASLPVASERDLSPQLLRRTARFMLRPLRREF
jgi:cardiolipin synthase